jgi:sialic acid synthase SpsE
MAKAFPEIILSTGMSDMQEIRESLQVLTDAGAKKEKITVLHCNTEYPTPMQDVNLRAMKHIQKELNVAIGYSDHTLGIEVAVAAIALGASIIEKHFTLDRNMKGPDHRASLEPDELKAMVFAIRNIEQALSGSGVKEPSQSELKNKTIARKSIHLKQSLHEGHRITPGDLVMKRPGIGISPMKMSLVLGKKIKSSLPADHLLSLNDLKD